ncbi:YoaK family protein, partial [uncultured Dubosiella sp.]
LEREPTVRFLSERKPPPLQVGEDVTTNDRIANLCMAFAGALQFHAFRKVKSLGMTSLACTGNYRAMAESLVMGVQTRKKAYLIRSGVYLLILALFFAGVCFSVLVQYRIGRYTIWIGCGILLWMSF